MRLRMEKEASEGRKDCKGGKKRENRNRTAGTVIPVHRKGCTVQTIPTVRRMAADLYFELCSEL